MNLVCFLLSFAVWHIEVRLAALRCLGGNGVWLVIQRLLKASNGRIIRQFIAVGIKRGPISREYKTQAVACLDVFMHSNDVSIQGGLAALRGSMQFLSSVVMKVACSGPTVRASGW